MAQTEVVRAAQAEAARIVEEADAEADRLRRECDGYVDTKLAEFEETLTKALRTVTRGRSQLYRGIRRARRRAAGPAPGWTSSTESTAAPSTPRSRPLPAPDVGSAR